MHVHITISKAPYFVRPQHVSGNMVLITEGNKVAVIHVGIIIMLDII